MPSILYIEDNPDSRRLVERILTGAGYTVLVAETGLQGIDLARRDLPDLILTDIMLPDLNGNEIATVLRGDSRFEKTPIVALTAQGADLKDIAFAAGIDGYLNKPLDVDALEKAVSYYLEGGRDTIDEGRLSAARAKYARETVTRLEARIRQLEEANDSLRKLDRMKEVFIQITAHELRTPLTLIFGYCRLLEDYPALERLMQADPNIKTLIQGLIESIERMHGTIDEIMTISRIMTEQVDLNVTQFDPGGVAEKVVKSYEDAVKERDITIDFKREQWPRVMYADAGLLRLTLNNLIGNAIKYTPNGGKITVSAATTESEIRVSVRDTGIGIDKEEQVRIFDEFTSLGSTDLHSSSKTAFQGGGLGLGLPVCKGIVQAHGGQIWAESAGHDPKTNPGSAFIFKMPLQMVRSRRKPVTDSQRKDFEKRKAELSKSPEKSS